ncbi:hypothetical protein EDB89DRAFT_1906568 [Lactarius sanguifluus]|nr:hypothetical protein EDB89DRAFT_1906568 [Lactarius sanguifluus]
MCAVCWSNARIIEVLKRVLVLHGAYASAANVDGGILLTPHTHKFNPAQHPWFKPKTLKRKIAFYVTSLRVTLTVDEDDPDSRIKRQYLIRPTLEHTCPQKRELPPSCPQSPIEEEDIVTKSRGKVERRVVPEGRKIRGVVETSSPSAIGSDFWDNHTVLEVTDGDRALCIFNREVRFKYKGNEYQWEGKGEDASVVGIRERDKETRRQEIEERGDARTKIQRLGFIKSWKETVPLAKTEKRRG